jgi:sulfate adenylyltransferase
MYMDKFLDDRELCDLECLRDGVFAPLSTYMTMSQYKRCLNEMKISDSDIFPIPIVSMSSSEAQLGTVLNLKTITGTLVATLTVEECWQPDIDKEFYSVLGSNDDNHPYIKYVKSKNPQYYLSGSLEFKEFSFHSNFMNERRTPAQTRELMSEGNWIGFQTRNPLHRSHIELIKRSAESSGAKVFLHPVEGVTQECDIPFPVRMKCYKEVLSYLGENVTLSILPLSMRMAGPREAVWHAVIRRNYGCSHFIVGRDHAGPSYKKKDGTSFYGPLEAQQLAKSLEADLRIKIVTSEEVVYCEDTQSYMTVTEAKEHSVKQISGTAFRSMLEKGSEVPEWFSYPSVLEPLKKFYQKPQGLCVYFTGLSGAGKTTLAQGLKGFLEESQPHREVTVLDADEIRTHLSKGLGFSKEDRSMNVRRIGYVASENVKHGGIVLVANIAPFKEDRDYNRRLISQYGKYVEVFVNTSLEVCESRDVKGLYKLARAGKITQFTGISDPYETPENALVVSGMNIQDSIHYLVQHIL